MKSLKTPIVLLAVFLCFFSRPGLSYDGNYATETNPRVVGPDIDPGEYDQDYDIETKEEIQTIEREDVAPGTPPSRKIVRSLVAKDEKVALQEYRAKKDKTLPGGRMKMSGHYRLAMGVSDEHQFFVNDANADLQERNFRYIFGERLNNTYDPAVYSQYLLNVDLSPANKVNFYTQLVADPWSYVGTTGEQIVHSPIDSSATLRYNLKYFGAFNSTLNEIYRTHYTDSIAFPLIKIHQGHTTAETVHGFFDYSPATGGVPFNIPEHEIDFEFRPIRKLWMDYNEDQWHARIFAFADERQALTTDDPLELSNHKDFWQQSPWLYQYIPIQFFTDHSFKRGYYSDALSFLARDSAGNRLVLLRGASVEGDFGKTYFAATAASPYTPWDEDIYTTIFSDNIPGAARLKHQVNDHLMLGSTYTFRNGLIDDSIADTVQVIAGDFKYDHNKNFWFKGQVAGSYHERDLLTNERIETSVDDYAYKGVVHSKFDHQFLGPAQADMEFSYTQMNQYFNPNLSRYTNTRDDHFWGNHISFRKYSDDLEHFRIGDGIDVNRKVWRFHWKDKFFKNKFENLFDIRHVQKESTGAYLETVMRDELTYHLSPKTTLKWLHRSHWLPKTREGIEPYLANFYFLGFDDPSSLELRNDAVPEKADPSRYTYSIAAQHKFDRQFTVELFYERTNDIPDFPRGLLNGTFRDKNDIVDGLLTDHLTSFLYAQDKLEATPPYDYFNIFRERLIYKPDDRLTYIFHAAQNEYHFAGGIDDNITHAGISIALQFSKKMSFFADYTFSKQIDLPKLIATNYNEFDYRGHHNVYASMDYKLRPDQLLRVEYGVFGIGDNTPIVTPFSVTSFSLPTIDTEHLLRVSLSGDF